MNTTTATVALPSASGARLTGDDVQHAVAWHAALRTLVPHAGVRSVTVEAANVGNVDDVVIARSSDRMSTPRSRPPSPRSGRQPSNG